VNISFSGPVWFWKGPSPFYFVTVPADQASEIREISHALTYGWGMVPCSVTIGATTFETALWPKEGSYIVPLKVAVRRAESIDVDQEVDITLTFFNETDE
jgi:hypothetical protein